MRSADYEMHDSPLSWRLLAANNRDVARSATPYPDLATCLKAVADLRAHIEDAVAVAARSGRADWSWRLRLNGEDVAVSSRTYQRRLQCEAACALFTSLVHDATIDLSDQPPAMAPNLEQPNADATSVPHIFEAAGVIDDPAARVEPVMVNRDSSGEPLRVRPRPRSPAVEST